MTEEQKRVALETLAKSEAREEKRREGRDIRWTSKKEGEEKSHSAVKGTLASIGVGAREGVKNTAANAKAFVKTDLGTGKAQGLKTAEKAVTEGVDYDMFMDQMRAKYGRVQTFWPMKMSQEDRDMYASVLQKKKLGLSDKQSLAQAQSEQEERQRAIDAERLVRSIKSKKALQAVDDRYKLGKVGEFAQDVGGAFGQMLPSLGVGVVNPAAGLAAFGVQAAAQGYGQALDEGATHEQAARYGVGTGLLEAGIEKATGGLSRFYGRGVLDRAMRMAPNNSVKNVILNTAKGAAGEGAEEAVSAIADPYLQRATYDPAAENASFSDAAYQAAIGAALGGILGGGSNALGYRAQKRAAERAQTGAGGAQGERTTINTSAQNAGLNGDLERRRTAQDGRDFTVDSKGIQDTAVKTGKIADESSHIDKRDYRSVGSRKMNAFSYDNPEIRPYYVTEAKRMRRELGEAQKPEMYFGVSKNGLKDTDAFVGGHGRIASSDIVTARDEIGLSYKEIDKALDDIIEDSGRENNANAKKLEVLFDQNLSMGTESDGYHIPPNAGYIRTKEGIAGAKDYGYKAEQARYESGEYDPISEDPYAFESTVYAIAQRRGHELTEAEAEEIEALQEVIDADRTAFTEEEIRQMIDEQVMKWKAPQKEAQSPYEQAFDEMLRGEDRAKPKAETEDERKVKDFIQSAAVRARMQVKYVDRPLVQKAYYKDGVIYINKNRPLDEGVKVTVAHELYHAMEGTKEHDTIVRLAFEGKDAEAMIAEKIEKYRQNGVELDETGARAEIGAEFIEKALTDEATINQVLLEDRTLAAKILERIKEIIAVYKAKKDKNMSAAEAREYAALLKARRLYEDGLEKLHKDEYSPAGVERSARYQAIKRTDDGRNYVSAETVNGKSVENKKRFALDEKTETPEFKQWFGDSKVVDENGKPKVMYHGSREKFTSMNKEKGGLLYFADKKYTAVGYATGSGGARKRLNNKDKYIVDAYDGTAFEYIDNGQWRAIGISDDEMPTFNNINRDKVGVYHEKGEIISSEKVMSSEEFEVLPKDFYVEEYFLSINNPLDLKNEPEKALKIFKDIKSKIGENKTLNDLIYRLSMDYPVWQTTQYEAFNHDWLNIIVPELKKLGYDGLFYRDDGHDTWAVFDSNQVKLVTNKKPTSNDDFRYSLDTKGEKDYQKRGKYLANSDENLQGFMKDSVVKNEDGTPKVVYSGHGNSNLFGGAWDIKKATSGGFYFTENPDIASSYAKDKLGNMETYSNGSEYRFKNAKGEYKDSIDKVRLSEEQVRKFDEWLMDDMGYTWDDYVRENAPYDKLLQGLRYNGGKYNLQNVYKLMESLGYADNGWNYSTNSQGKSTFEELLDDMGIEWDSYTKQAGGVFPVYLDIRNPIDTSKPFPQDLLNALEYAASKERKSADADSAHWTKDYPLKEWVEDIKRGADGWATQVPTKARKIMLDLGYDGIKDTGGKMLGDTNHTVWVALEPTQIKSATGNRGTFDASKKDIRYAVDDGDAVSGMDFESDSEAKKVGYRFFDNTFQNTPIFDEAVKEIERSYEHERTRTSEKENIAEAKRRLKENGWRKEINTVLNKSSVDGADTDVAMAIISQLNNYATDSAEFGRIMKFAEDYAEKTVESGQFIQSLAKYTRTPEGKTQKAMRDIKREENRLQETNPKEWNEVEKKSAKAKAAVKSAQEEAAGEAVDEAVQNISKEVAEKIVNNKRKGKTKKSAHDDLTDAEKLANKIKGQVNKSFAKDEDTVDNARLQKDIINELYRLAKESPLPDKAIEVQKKDYVKIMRDILHNQKKYEDIWDEAKEMVAKKYKDDAKKMAALEDYFDNYTVPIYSEKSMRIAVKGAMDDLKLDVQNILTANKADKAKAQEKIKTLLGEKLGFEKLDAETVDVVSNDIVNTFEKMLQKKARKKLEAFLKEEVKDVKKRDAIEKQMMRMVRGGYFSEDEVVRIVRKAFDVPSLTTEEVQEILSHYKMADNYAEGSYERRKWEAKAQKIIADKVPKTLAEKNKTARRVAMLLNPGTWWRNIDGNIIFGAAEMVKNVPAGLADMAVSMVTGKRTTSANVAADVGAYAKGVKRGAQEWWQDIQSGVDTSHSAVREEYQTGGKVFSEKHLYGRLYNKADTVVAKALQLGDRPFYEGAYEQRINEMKRLGYDVKSENVQAEAKIYALERVYQNDSKLSRALTNVRNELGLFGHFLIPFTQTPGNLLDKCIDYSGAGGLARALVQIGQAKNTGVFDQKLFVDRIGRALTGLGTMAFGAFLYTNGWLTGTDDDDYKVSGAERLAGKKEYALHIGDNYYTIDWAQPVSAVLIAGAEAHKAGIEADDWQQMAIASGKGVINTLFAMSCLEGLESMMSSYGSAEPADKIAEVMISGVGQYFPTTIRRLNNVIDPYQRQTYDPNPLIKQGKYILSGVPGASYLLAHKYTLEGEVQMKSQGRGIGSRVYENFLVPYNKTKEYHSEVNDELLRIYEKTGAKSQFLHYAQKKLDYGDGGKYILESEDYNRMQEEIGQNVTKADKELIHSSVYKSMSDDDKADALGVIATYYDNKFKEEYAKKNKIDFTNTNYEGLKKKLADSGSWTNYFAIKEAFPDSNYDVAKKRKDKCDKYGIDYTAYAESNAKIAELRSANSERYTKASDKTEANKRAIAQYLAGRKDLTNPQRQVIWQEYYKGKTSETWISVARRYGF